LPVKHLNGQQQGKTIFNNKIRAEEVYGFAKDLPQQPNRCEKTTNLQFSAAGEQDK